MKNELLKKETILDELRSLKPILANKFGVKKLALFGSFTKDRANSESDIDVVVELEEPDMFSFVHIKETLENDFNRPVDVIPYTELMNKFLKQRIDAEAIYV